MRLLRALTRCRYRFTGVTGRTHRCDQPIWHQRPHTPVREWHVRNASQ